MGAEGANGKRAAASQLLLAVVAVCLFAIAPARADRLTVATYNVENYLSTDRLDEGAYRSDFPKPETAKTALRAVIRSMNADVLAVQEMGPLPYLKELQRDLRREGCDYPHAELLQADDPDRLVAVLSKRPLIHIGRHTDLAFTYFGKPERVKRGLLEVRVATGVGELTILVTHLKSRFTDRSDDALSAVRRAAEAEAVRDKVLELFPDPARVRLVLVGDLNDLPGSRPLRALCQRGTTRILEPLPARDGRGEGWTHWYRKEDTYSRVDYVLVSPGLKPFVAGGAAVVVDKLPETRDASDHRPVLVALEFPDGK